MPDLNDVELIGRVVAPATVFGRADSTPTADLVIEVARDGAVGADRIRVTIQDENLVGDAVQLPRGQRVAVHGALRTTYRLVVIADSIAPVGPS